MIRWKSNSDILARLSYQRSSGGQNWRSSDAWDSWCKITSSLSVMKHSSLLSEKISYRILLYNFQLICGSPFPSRRGEPKPRVAFERRCVPASLSLSSTMDECWRTHKFGGGSLKFTIQWAGNASVYGRWSSAERRNSEDAPQTSSKGAVRVRRRDYRNQVSITATGQ